jgi:hypothetical protein
MKKSLAVSITLLAALIGCGAAVAAQPDESATVLWGSFKATTKTPTGFSFVSGSKASNTNAFIDPFGGTPGSSANWTSNLGSNETSSGVTATSAIVGSSLALLTTNLFGNGELPVSTPSAYANAYRSASFTLGAGDSVTFSFCYLLTASTLGLPANETYDDNVYAMVLGPLAGTDSIVLNSTGIKSGTLSYTVTNHTLSTQTDTIYLGAASYEYTSAVPEPSTYALLLAGLCMVFVARRRGRKNS